MHRYFRKAEKNMRTITKLAMALCVFTAPVFLQIAGVQIAGAQMSGMTMEHAAPTSELLREADTRPPLKLEDFLTMADGNNPTLQQAAALLRRSQGNAKQAALYPNPTVGYEGDQIRGGSYGGGEQGGFIAQTIVLGGKLNLRRNIYEQQQQSDKIAIESQRLRVHNDVTQMFYNTLSAQQTVLVRGRLLGLATDAVETAHHLANVGQADAPDVLQAEVEAEQAQIDFEVAQRMFIQRFKGLAALAGKPATGLAHLDATLYTPPEIDAAHIVDTIVEQSPSVKEAEQQVIVAEAKLKGARREVIPDLQLKVGEQANLEALPEARVRKPARKASPAPVSSCRCGIATRAMWVLPEQNSTMQGRR
jgi:outer membrane protein, heavy metal efflux system